MYITRWEWDPGLCWWGEKELHALAASFSPLVFLALARNLTEPKPYVQLGVIKEQLQPKFATPSDGFGVVMPLYFFCFKYLLM